MGGQYKRGDQENLGDVEGLEVEGLGVWSVGGCRLWGLGLGFKQLSAQGGSELTYGAWRYVSSSSFLRAD